MRPPHRQLSRFVSAVTALLLTGGCTDSTTESQIARSVAQVDAQRLRRHVEWITAPGPRSVQQPETLRSTTDYISAQLRDYAIPVREEPLPVSGTNTQVADRLFNLVATFPGSLTHGPLFEIGAHYDTVETTPGADDNASGLAALLEIARILSRTPNRRTIRLCFFAQEEQHLKGSTRHVSNMIERDERLAGAIIFEMIGYTSEQPDSQRSPARVPLLFSPPRTGNFITVVGNFRSGGIGNRFEAAAARYVPELPLFSVNRLGGLFKDALRSDHKPYWDRGQHAIMLTDTANFRNPNYHRSSDTADTLDYEFLTTVTRASLATVLTWSGLDQPPGQVTP